MAFLSDDQKKLLGPFLIVVQVYLAACAGYFMYVIAGGEPIQILNVVVPLTLGLLAGWIVFKQLQK